MQSVIKSLRTLFAFATYCAMIMICIGFYRSALQAPNPTVLVHDRHGQFLAELSDDEKRGQGFWPLQHIPQRVAAATLAIEDQYFWTHPGVNPIAITRAFWQNLISTRRISGASTIAMQVARLQAPANRNYANKLLEAATALAMTLRHGREQILKHYLRMVPYGNNIHGIGFAARRYLNKPIEDLSWAEIAFLSAIPQSPARMNPYHYNGRLRAIKRGLRILKQLHIQNIIDDAEYAMAQQQIHHIEIPVQQVRPDNAIHAILQIENELHALPDDKLRTLPSPMLTASLDINLQDQVSDIVSRQLDRLRPRGAGNAAAIVVDRRDNSILSWVGSVDYFDSQYGGAIDYASIKRSSGSTLKPFFYALALERGDINAATLLDDVPSSSLGLRNADHHYLGPVLPRQALANSRNVPMAQLVNLTGLETDYRFLQNLGLHQEEYPAQHYGLGIALGALPVSLKDLMTAYTALADDGVLSHLSWFKELPDHHFERVLSQGTARQISLFLSDPTARLPSFPRMGHSEYPFPVALKTGTSQAFRDAWTIAYSKRYLVGVWIGDPNNRPMYKLGGYASAAVIVKQILSTLHHKQRKGDSDLGFATPRGFKKVRLCANSGKLAGQRCEHYYDEWLKPNQIPAQRDPGTRQVIVDRRNGGLATETTPLSHRQLRVVQDLPPRFAVWASQQVGMTTVSQEGLLKTRDIGNRNDDAAQLPLLGEQPLELNILSPRDGARIILNPEMPSSMSTIELNVEAIPAIQQLTWYVDDKPYKNANYPYNIRLPLTRGKHRIYAAVPLTDERSNSVTIQVD